VCALALWVALLSAWWPGTANAVVGPPKAGSGVPEVKVIATEGASAKFKISCPGQAPGLARAPCVGHVGLSAHVHKVGKRVTAVSATGRTVQVTVGGAHYVVFRGTSATITLTLNKLGRRLIALFYTLPASVTFTGAVTAPGPVLTFSYGRVDSTFLFTWTWTPSSSRLVQLTVSGIPPGGSVLVVCNGGGCPPHRETVVPEKREAALTDLLAGARLRPGTTIWFAVTAPNDVGKVIVFVVRAGDPPTTTLDCLPPGVAKPRACVT
jgi:hypothetical protein